MNIHHVDRGDLPAKDPRVNRANAASKSSATARPKSLDAVSLDREALDRVSDLKSRIIESPEVRRERIEELRVEFQEGRLRQQAVFEATAEAILKGNSVIDDVDLRDLI